MEAGTEGSTQLGRNGTAGGNLTVGASGENGIASKYVSGQNLPGSEGALSKARKRLGEEPKDGAVDVESGGPGDEQRKKPLEIEPGGKLVAPENQLRTVDPALLAARDAALAALAAATTPAEKAAARRQLAKIEAMIREQLSGGRVVSLNGTANHSGVLTRGIMKDETLFPNANSSVRGRARLELPINELEGRKESEAPWHTPYDVFNGMDKLTNGWRKQPRVNMEPSEYMRARRHVVPTLDDGSAASKWRNAGVATPKDGTHDPRSKKAPPPGQTYRLVMEKYRKQIKDKFLPPMADQDANRTTTEKTAPKPMTIKALETWFHKLATGKKQKEEANMEPLPELKSSILKWDMMSEDEIRRRVRAEQAIPTPPI